MSEERGSEERPGKGVGRASGGRRGARDMSSEGESGERAEVGGIRGFGGLNGHAVAVDQGGHSWYESRLDDLSIPRLGCVRPTGSVGGLRVDRAG